MTIKEATVRVDDLQEHPLNYNVHPPEQIAELRQSLAVFGQVRNIVVFEPAEKGGAFLIVAGHGLVTAARLEGIKELRANVIPADWPPAKVAAYMAADNEQARKSQPDNVQLASILVEARNFDEKLLAAIGYSDDEFYRLLGSVGAGDEEVALRDVPTQKPPRMTWVLFGIETVKFGRIAGLVEKLADDPEIIIETTVADE